MSQHIEITRIFDAPRSLVYRAFTDPDEFAQWFGPVDCSVPRDSVEIDARTGVPGVAGTVRVHLRLEFHDDGRSKTRLELRQGPFATGQLGADTRSGWESSFTKLDALL
jgi:uncharacterized protein YndB with AHSA1/START domain